jgi:hypothetical protein
MVNCKNYTEQGGSVTHFGGKVIFEEGCEIEGLPSVGTGGGGAAENQADSTASTVASLREDLNSLLSKLKAAGLMAADAETPTEPETPAEDGEAPTE